MADSWEELHRNSFRVNRTSNWIEEQGEDCEIIHQVYPCLIIWVLINVHIHATNRCNLPNPLNPLINPNLIYNYQSFQLNYPATK